MPASVVRILDGNTFVVSDERGDIEASTTDPTGLFSYDTRFLSHWVLTVNDLRLNALSTDDLQYFEARFFLVPATGTVYIDPKLSVIRERAVGNGFHEDYDEPVPGHQQGTDHNAGDKQRGPLHFGMTHPECVRETTAGQSMNSGPRGNDVVVCRRWSGPVRRGSASRSGDGRRSPCPFGSSAAIDPG